MENNNIDGVEFIIFIMIIERRITQFDKKYLDYLFSM